MVFQISNKFRWIYNQTLRNSADIFSNFQSKKKGLLNLYNKSTTSKSPSPRLRHVSIKSGWSPNLTDLLHRLRSCLLSTAMVKLLPQPSAILLVKDRERRRKALVPVKILNPRTTVTLPADPPREAKQRNGGKPKRR